MGNLNAIEAATTMTDMVGLTAALDYHLTANHFPPVPRSMIPVCIEAIGVVVDVYEGDDDIPTEEVELPEGITFRGRETAPAFEIVEAHHLWAFVDAELERRETLGDDAGDRLHEHLRCRRGRIRTNGVHPATRGRIIASVAFLPC